MKLKLAQLSNGQNTVLFQPVGSELWIPVGPALSFLKLERQLPSLHLCSQDVVQFLQYYEAPQSAKELEQIIEQLKGKEERFSTTYKIEKELQPFSPKSFRDGSLWEKHSIDAARGLVYKFIPAAKWIVFAYENIFPRMVFPMLKPKKMFYERPLYYMASNTNMYATGSEVPYPPYAKYLDYELELGIVITKTIRNATPKEALDAMGGFILVNDFSERSVQMPEMLSGRMGFTKAKAFATGLGPLVVTKDELRLRKLDSLTAEVRVNNKVVSRGEKMGKHQKQFTAEELVAFISSGETLYPGELIALGTVPGCSSIETHGKGLQPGDTVELRLGEELGVCSHTIGLQEKVDPNHWRGESKKSKKINWLLLALLLPIILLIANGTRYWNRIDPSAWNPPTSKHFDQFENVPIYNIHRSQRMYCPAPESFTTDQYGNLYYGIRDGSIRRINTAVQNLTDAKEEFVVRTSEKIPFEECHQRSLAGDTSIEHLCGRVLGLDFDDLGRLVFADNTHGILRVDSQEENGIVDYDGQLRSNLQVTTLVTHYKEEKLKFFNSIALRSDSIYFTDSSTKFKRPDYRLEVLESKPTGRFFRYDLDTKEVELILDGLYFANGLASSQDGRYIYISDMMRYRIIRYDTITRSHDIFMENLFCIVDNLTQRDGLLYLGCSSTRSAFMDKILSPYPIVKKIINCVPYFEKVFDFFKSKEGIIMTVDEQGSVTQVFYDKTGTHFKWLSEAFFYEGWIYAGSVMEDVLRRIKI
jgi:2-keto-4-pentenoate hydratase/2-oxohepta-3-ene-1,7-dioic acid hydratase in catechol pathway/sugar lactone lactonase YvrE